MRIGSAGRGGDGHRGAPATGPARHRTPAGDVILQARRPDAPIHGDGPGRPDRRATRWRAAAAVLAVLAAAAALVTGVALSGRGLASTPGTALAASTPARTTSPPASTVRPYPSTPAPGVGSISDARERVAGFVTALNHRDFGRANAFLCADMAGSYGAWSLDGIVPGTLQVGGVAVEGDTGTAIVTFRLMHGSQPGRSLFGLVIEHGRWMVCHPQ